MADVMVDRDGDSGRYQETYPLDEFVDSLAGVDVDVALDEE